MFRTVIATGFVLLAAIASWFGFASPRRRAEFVFTNTTGINTLDPAQLSWIPDIRVATNIWEGLTSYHPRTIEPIEGTAYFPPHISDDGLVYTFTIRGDARWSNGDPVTSADFIRGWRRCLEPGCAGDYAALFYDYIAGAREYYDWRNQFVGRLTTRSRGEASAADQSEIRNLKSEIATHAAEMDARWSRVGLETPDPQTLRVHLKRPCPYFLSLTAFATFVPIHASIELLRERFAGLPITAEGLVVYDPQWTKPDYHARGYPGLITNGAFAMKEWVFKDYLRMVANPSYWERDTVAVTSIDMLIFGDSNGAVMAYEDGQVDCLFDMATAYDHELARLAITGQRKDFYCPTVMGTYYYNFNCRDAEILGRANPFIDARVRKAFNLAVDRQPIVENIVANGNPPSSRFIPPGMIPGYDSPAGLDYNRDEARRLLAAAGFPQGAGLPPIEILYDTGSPHHERIAQAIARQWQRELGVRVDLRGKEGKTFADDKQKHNFLISRANWYADYMDPTTFLDIFSTGNGNNDSGYSNPVYDELLHRAAAADNPNARMAILRDAEALLIQEECPILPLYVHTNLMAIKPYVCGIYPNPRLNFPFKYVRIDRSQRGFADRHSPLAIRP